MGGFPAKNWQFYESRLFEAMFFVAVVHWECEQWVLV